LAEADVVPGFAGADLDLDAGTHPGEAARLDVADFRRVAQVAQGGDEVVPVNHARLDARKMGHGGPPKRLFPAAGRSCLARPASSCSPVRPVSSTRTWSARHAFCSFP